jgi:hypothetical protein
MLSSIPLTINEIIWFFILSAYATAVTLGTKISYEFMRKKGFEKNGSCM